MFRFAIDNTVDVNADEATLATHAVTRDDDFYTRLQETDDVTDDETVFMAERDAETPEAAAEFVNGLLYRFPTRVWLADGTEHRIDADTLGPIDAPGD